MCDSLWVRIPGTAYIFTEKPETPHLIWVNSLLCPVGGMVGEGDPLECYTFACELTVSKLLNFPPDADALSKNNCREKRILPFHH